MNLFATYGETMLTVGAAWALVWFLPPVRSAKGLRGLAVLAVALLAGVVGAPVLEPSPAERAEQGYLSTWEQLERAADQLSSQLKTVDSSPREGLRLELFRFLQDNSELLSGSALGDRGVTVLVFDGNDEAIAWHGPGLLHEPEIWALEVGERSWHSADTALSLWTTRSLAEEGLPWRLVVGLSTPLQPFPFAKLKQPVDWALADSASKVPEGASVLAGSSVPVLWWRPMVEEQAGGMGQPAGELSTFLGAGAHEAKYETKYGVWTSRITVLGWAVILLWGLLHLLVPRPKLWNFPKFAYGALACGVSLLGAWGVAASVGATPAVALVGAVATSSLAWVMARKLAELRALNNEPSGDEAPGGESLSDRTDRSLSVLRRLLPLLQGAVIFAGLLAGSRALQGSLGPLDLSAQGGLTVDAFVLRWAAGAAALALLLLLPKRSAGSGSLLPVALLGLSVAAAAHDTPWVATCFGALGSGCFGLWWSGATERSSPARLGVMALAASVIASTAWQTAERIVLRQQIQEIYLPLVVPPVDDELNDILIELQAYFETWNPEDTGLSRQARAPSSSREDLAFRLWLQSPLPQRDGLSALVVEDLAGQRSSFSFGLPLGRDSEPMPDTGRLRVPKTRAWTEKVYGEAEVFVRDEAWGRIRYWFLPRPGFRISVDELGELERTLVREKSRGDMADGLPRGAQYAYFSLTGRALTGPWETLPPLPAEFLAALPVQGRVETPEGPSWCWLEPDDEGLTVIFLPVLQLRAGLERVGSVALTMLPWLMAVAWLIWLIPSTRSGLGDMLQRSFRSYSKRLILVYTVLLLVPLVALNLILLRSFSERLQEEQLHDAQRAMVSARELLVNFLNGLQPGVAIETQVNRELLEWMSDLVQHQVSLYWGSRIYRSSQEELFTSGLLPRRIPGEIFTRLTLLGHGMELRRRRTGDLAYLEVYAPLDVPGVVSSQQELFVSVPLLEQEEAAERQLAELQRRALLVTSALFGLLLAVGSRLTRGFTRPIVELIAGTRRIARGEPFPQIRPRETELSDLAEAIATMAVQVDESRRGLVREKHFVERVVANITSAVVSLDHQHRVAFQNQVAADLLGTKVGESIGDRLTGDEGWAPLREFWLSVKARETPKVEQVKLRPAGERVDIREWTLTWVPIPGGGNPAALLVVDDDTEVLRGQRLEAWAEMARIIAHEIKNPLTPIQLSAEHLRQVRRTQPDRFDEIFDRCMDNILTNVDELRSIASEFSIYSRIPAAKLELADLGQAMSELSASYRDAAEQGVTMRMTPPAEPLMVPFDEKLLGRAVRNLIENAYRAAAPSKGLVELSVSAEQDSGLGELAVVEVRDSGPGVDPQKLSRIFEPYFSTYKTGTGLGLAIVRRIVDEHGGEVEARNRPGGGLSVIIRIPLAAPSADPDGGPR